ncbi:alkaline phosphatase-like [Penaeus monodon]|uniref:alkaline phosphatase-like n=1 Tax=Penaeus monodon TaxID=6687 RepID=UPI0018A7A989|nr:alkaline phosphatase-like [Penaeus monodon]
MDGSSRGRGVTWLATTWALLVAIAAEPKAPAFPVPSPEDTAHWHQLAANDLQDAMFAATMHDWSIAKNVVMFVGDGMGITPSVAGRIYKGQRREGSSGEEGYLAWERFPNMGLMKTYVLNKQVPDSAATATAYLTGAKANMYTLGVDHTVMKDQCMDSLDPEKWRNSVLKWAQDAGKNTGFVTTTRLTHATPAALYAHTANRDWECDAKLGSYGHGCRDIAKQFVEDTPGRDINVALAGGRFVMGASKGEKTKLNCVRGDGRNLTEEWLRAKRAHGHTARYVTNTRDLLSTDYDSTDYLLGLFADDHLDYEADRDRGPLGQPSLANMTRAAIKMLSKNVHKGFFLLVEGGRIDHALHDTQPRRALEDVLALDDAVADALSTLDLDNTLIIVTADHSHVMTINGYSQRGNDILGTSDEPSDIDQMTYTTLMFTNGPAYNYSWNGVNVTRPDPKTQNTTELGYKSLAAVPLSYETHGGEDVAAYAIGPMSHLLHRVHEQSYLAHVMGFASCIGPYKDNCERPKSHFSRFLPRVKSYRRKIRL